VHSSFGFPASHSASTLADVLQFVATMMEKLLEERMVLAVVCGPIEGIGSYKLHGPGVPTCSSTPAMDAVSRSVDGAEQAVQLVASANEPTGPRHIYELTDEDLFLAQFVERRGEKVTPATGTGGIGIAHGNAAASGDVWRRRPTALSPLPQPPAAPSLADLVTTCLCTRDVYLSSGGTVLNARRAGGGGVPARGGGGGRAPPPPGIHPRWAQLLSAAAVFGGGTAPDGSLPLAVSGAASTTTI